MISKRNKRLNWTGRIKLDKSCIDVAREEGDIDQAETVTINLNLADYSFPKSAAVRIEATHRLTSMRFDFGTIDEMSSSKKLGITYLLTHNDGN